MVAGDRLLWQVVRYGGGWTVALAGFAVVGVAAELLLPAVLGRALDAVLAGDGMLAWLGGAVALVLLAAGAEIFRDLATGLSRARATARLRHALVGHLLALAPGGARRFPAGDLVSRLVAQVPAAGQAGPTGVLLIATLLPPLGALVALALIDPWLAVTFVAALLVLMLVLRTFVSDASDAATGYQRSQSRIADRFTEALAGARTIGTAGTVDWEVDRVLGPLPELRDYGLRTWTTLARAAGRSAAVAPMLQLGVVAVAGVALSAGRLSPGQLFAALQYAAIGAGVGATVEALHTLATARAGCRRSAEVLTADRQQYGDSELPAGTGRLELRGVAVHSDAGPLLDAVDLVVPGGTALAVVGRSGSGKTVLAEVAGRLRDPDRGEVRLDGVPLTELSHSALRTAIGYAFDRPVLVGETIGEVIGLGATAAEPAWTREAARTACVDTFVDRLPDGYATRLADTPMSGGEAQRLGLARALHASRVLILDDATSSLDTVTEVQVSRALAAAAGGRTRLVVAHRVGTAASCDLVAWLQDGRLRRVGPHQQLWQDAGYRALFRAEDGGGADPTGDADPAGAAPGAVAGADEGAGGRP